MPQARPADDLNFVRSELGTDLDALLVFSLLRTHACLGPCIDSGLRPLNLTGAQFNALLLLRSAGSSGLLMGEIGQHLVVTKANVTGLVDRLEDQGLVSRHGTEDRRATVVRLTRAGGALLRTVLPRHAALLEQLTGCLTRSEKETLIRLHSKLRRALRGRRGQGAGEGAAGKEKG